MPRYRLPPLAGGRAGFYALRMDRLQRVVLCCGKFPWPRGLRHRFSQSRIWTRRLNFETWT